MSDDLLSILEQSQLFREFTPQQLEDVMVHMQPKAITLDAGKHVYDKGEPADRCWLIQSGNLVVKRASLRTPFRKMIYHTGAVTGIQGLADPGSKRAVTMIAEDEVRLVEITHEGTLLLENETQLQLWKNVSRLLLHKLFLCLSRESFD